MKIERDFTMIVFFFGCIKSSYLSSIEGEPSSSSPYMNLKTPPLKPTFLHQTQLIPSPNCHPSSPSNTPKSTLTRKTSYHIHNLNASPLPDTTKTPILSLYYNHQPPSSPFTSFNEIYHYHLTTSKSPTIHY